MRIALSLLFACLALGVGQIPGGTGRVSVTVQQEQPQEPPAVAVIDGLVSYWSLDEASGNALDAHGSNDLTETSGTIDATTGKVGGARDFESGDTEYFTAVDNAALSVGDIDFALACWVHFESTLLTADIVSKDDGSSQREYILQFLSGGGGGFRLVVWSPAGALTTHLASTLGAPSNATWYFVVAWHDAANNTLNIQINNGTVDSASYSAGVKDGTSAFAIGAKPNASSFMDGLIDEVGFWKKVLTSDERTWLYNDGAGRSYADIVAEAGGGGLSIPIAMYHYMHRLRRAS